MAASTEQKPTPAPRQHNCLENPKSYLAPDLAFARKPVLPLSATQHLMVASYRTGTFRSEEKNVQGLSDAVRNLRVEDTSKNSDKGLLSGAQASNGALRVDVAVEDDQTHLSNSSTKPASLDGKSVASGTTFALDEKESLRPDDSASVKAAEEEESFSGPASGAPSSRVGSEAGSRAFRDQFYEISDRIGQPPHRNAVVNRFGVPGIQEEDMPGLTTTSKPVTPDQQVSADTGEFRGVVPPYGFPQKGPDEKLLEALESPKDRLFLLKLEQDVISFVRDSK